MSTKKRYILYLGVILAVILSSFFWGYPGQSRNMRHTRIEIASLKKKLEDDARFTHVNILFSTANFGKSIFVKGTVPDQQSLDYLKTLIDQSISSRFTILYSVQLETNTTVPLEHRSNGP